LRTSVPIWSITMANASSGNSSSSKTLLWMMVAMILCVGVLLGGGFSLSSRMVQALGIQASTSRDTLRTANGTFRLEQEKQVGPGLPLYPRSSLMVPGPDSAGQAVKNLKNGVSVVTYHAPDNRDFVDSWYSQHLSPEFKRRDAAENPTPEVFRAVGVPDSDIAFVAERGEQTRIVALSLDATGTTISLIRFDKAVAQ
jgi:hypothetical protein